MFGSNFFDSLTLFSDQPWFNINFYVEITFVGIITYLVFQKAYKPKTAKKDATAGVSDAEVEKRLAEWRPADLVPPSAGTVAPPVVQSLNGAKVSLQGDPKSYVNFITQNYAGLVGDKRVEADCKKVIMKYGVGSCGPRGFYGSIDVHIECEEQIAKFMGTETAILYSYDAATPVSVIPAFAKKGDLIMADAGVNFNIKTGLHLCKSNVVFFDHNDMDDLEAKLNEQMQRDKKKPPKPLNRRFIVVEGIYVNYGDIAPLDALVRLRNQFKFRLIVDESVSVGTLGATGRGLTEHFGLKVSQVDIICASMSNAIASVGGFCVGSKAIVKHQRLSGAGYCFSASLPPFVSQGSTTALQVIDEEPQRLARLRTNVRRAREGLCALRSQGLVVSGAMEDEDGGYSDYGESALIHARLDEDGLVDTSRFEAIAARVKEAGVLIAVASYSTLEADPPPPSLRWSVTTDHSDADIDAMVKAVGDAIKSIPT